MVSAAELAVMWRAIALAAAGLGTTSPNPPVGCVLLGPGNQIAAKAASRNSAGPASTWKPAYWPPRHGSYSGTGSLALRTAGPSSPGCT
jgi:tRNA(Arg) A34 adenosine deaminase TadA